MRIAEHAGLFKKHGLEPRIIVMDSGNASTTALIAGSSQFAGSGPDQPIAARVHGQTVYIIANLYRGMSGAVAVSTKVAERAKLKPDATPAEKFRALDGLTIAAPSATSALLQPVKNGVIAAGVQAKYTYMAQPAMVAALQAGAIDGFVASSPFPETAAVRGIGVIWVSGPKGEFPADINPASAACLQVTDAYARANPDTVRRMRAVFADLSQLVTGAPGQAKEALAKAYPSVDAATIDTAFAQNAQSWAQTSFSEADVKREIDLLKSAGGVPGLERIEPRAMLLPGA